MKGLLKNNFLGKTYTSDKNLFILFAVFILFQAFFTGKAVETLPFFNYGMYSEKSPVKKEYSGLFIQFNHASSDISRDSSIPEDYVFSIVNHYAMLKQNNFTDPIQEVIEHRFKGKVNDELYDAIDKRLANTTTDLSLFPAWLGRYLNSFSPVLTEHVNLVNRNYEWQGGAFILTEEQFVDSFSYARQ
jgi:hypothetical protein